MAKLEWAGFDRLIARLSAIANPDANPLMIEWRIIIEDDNKAGVLAGTDKDGVPMIPVTYRPKLPAGAKPKKWSKKQQTAHMSRRGIFHGMGPTAAGFDDNLTSAQYRMLGGPPLAPRGANSRVIRKLETGHTTAPVNGVWTAVGAWPDVVSAKGVPFLMAHFTGGNIGSVRNIIGGFSRLPVRDLRGVRPAGRKRALAAAKKWLLNVVKGKP